VTMTSAQQSAMRELERNVQRFTPVIAAKLGLPENSPIVYSIAKYYPAIERLAAE